MKTLLVAFGDSWTFGSELDIPREQPWPVHIANKLDAETLNLSIPAGSIGHLVLQLYKFINDYSEQYANYKKIFMVGLSGSTRLLSYSNELKEFINILPEAVYRTSNIHHSGKPPEVYDSLYTLSKILYTQVVDNNYLEFLSSQVIMMFQQYSKLNNIDCLFFSYFDQQDFGAHSNILDLDTIYPRTITHELTGEEYQLPNIIEHEYFRGKLFHPNIAGHKRIAELLIEFYDQQYPRN
jgi:hypothetical protein